MTTAAATAAAAPATGRTDLAPLSYQQEEMLRQLRERPQLAPAYDNVYLFELPEAVDPDHVLSAIDGLVQRHPALRTTIASTATGIAQRVHPRAVEPPGVERFEGSPYTATLVARQLSVQAVCEGRALFRGGVCVAGRTRSMWLALHHLVSDQWSDTVMWRDLSELYRARLDNRPPLLPELTTTYAGFAAAQRATWPALRERAVPFWQHRLRGPSRIDWVRPGPGPARSTGVAAGEYDCDAVSVVLGPAELLAIRTAVRLLRVTPFMVLLAASALGAADVLGADSLLAGSNAAGRHDRATRDLIGYFVNTWLTTVDAGRGRSLLDVVHDVRDCWVAADEFRAAYTDQVLAALDRPDVVKVDLYGVPPLPGPTGEKFSSAGPTLSGVPLAPVPIPELTHQYWRDLNLLWVRDGGSYRLNVMYRLNRVDRSTAAAVAAAVVAALRVPTDREGSAASAGPGERTP